MSNWRSSKSRSSYWEKNNYKGKRKHQYNLQPGITGFLCTCIGKFREKECVRDSYNILNEYADEIFGPESGSVNETTAQINDARDEVVDIEASLEGELADLKKQRASPVKERRFQVVESGANGIVFIKTTVPDTVKLSHHIVASIAESKVQKSKFLLRLLPVEVVCHANMNDIKAAADTLFEKYFSEGEKTFSILFSHRNNDRLSRDVVIDELAKLVDSKNSSNKVDLKTPQYAVLVEIIRGFCCLSVIPDYYKLKKYNILELCNISETATAPVQSVDKEAPQPKVSTEPAAEGQPEENNSGTEPATVGQPEKNNSGTEPPTVGQPEKNNSGTESAAEGQPDENNSGTESNG